MTSSLPCKICTARATPALRNRPDHEYGVPVRLDYWRCTSCGLVFADPIPSALIPSFYAAYSTHESSHDKERNGLWKLMDAITPALDGAGSFMSFNVSKTARILDFGCGAGSFLEELQRAGFTDISGCDFDPKVAAAALPGLRFFSGIEQLGSETFDVITMNHVLEHVENVPATLAQLRSHLNPHGFIYVRTPNPSSALAAIFRANWRGWETPRHLNLLTSKAMQRAVEQAGGELTMLVTSNDMHAGILMGSMGIAFGPGFLTKLAGAALYAPGAWLLKAWRAIAPLSGEELVAIVR